MIGAHAAGYYFSDMRRAFSKTAEACHLVGSLLFLGNIALIGQIYHLSARPPNAILLWWLGIAAFPWLLRSKVQHLLVLIAFGVWFGLEANQSGSLLYFGGDQYQMVLYALLGLAFLGFGYSLHRTSFSDFSEITEIFGLLIFQLCSYPLTWRFFYEGGAATEPAHTLTFALLALIAALLIAIGLRAATPSLTSQWRFTWAAALACTAALVSAVLFIPRQELVDYRTVGLAYNWLIALALFVFCLLQVQVGLKLGSPAMVNMGIVFIAL